MRGSIWNRSVRCLLTGGAAIAALSAVSPAFAQAKSFDLPAQPAGRGISAFAKQAGVQIIASEKLVRSKRTNRVVGNFAVDEGLKVLLSGTGLVAVRVGTTGIFTIRAAESSAATRSAATQEIEDSSEITVIGSRIRGGPATSPVTSVTRREAEQLGQTDLGQIIRDLPQNFSGGQNPSFSAAGQGGFTNVSGSSALNLRGLGPDASLTLFNGHRVAFDAISQGVDISAIPLSAIERIDIMTDGASALYGSDAVAGVANVVLRREVDTVTASARLGQQPHGNLSMEARGAFRFARDRYE